MGVGVLCARLTEMHTTFVKFMQHAPMNGWKAICQRDSRLFGVVGMNS